MKVRCPHGAVVDTELDHPDVATVALMTAARQGYRQREDWITLVECGSAYSDRLRRGPAGSS